MLIVSRMANEAFMFGNDYRFTINKIAPDSIVCDLWHQPTALHEKIVLVRNGPSERVDSIDVVVSCVDIRGDKARIGIELPTTLPIHRREVWEAIQREELKHRILKKSGSELSLEHPRYWEPDAYKAGEVYRQKSSNRLLSLIPVEFRPREVVDLGCGMGRDTIELAARYPKARVLGIDDSAEMIEEAKKHIAANLRFERDQILDFTPGRPIDLCFCHFVLHWIKNVKEFVSYTSGLMSHNGILALAVPRYTSTRAWRVMMKRIGDPVSAAKKTKSALWYAEKMNQQRMTILHAADEVLQWRLSHRQLVEWFRGSLLRAYFSGITEVDELLVRNLAEGLDERMGSGERVFYMPITFVVARKDDR